MSETMTNVEVVETRTIWFTIIQTIYGIPCIFLMVFAFIYMGVKKRFNSGFYKLCRMDLFVNISLYINTWLGMRFEKYPFCIPMLKFIEIVFPGFLTFSRYLTQYFFHLQFVSAVGMPIHRILTMKGLNRTNKFWNIFVFAYFVGAIVYSCIPNFIFYFGFPSKTLIINGTLYRVRNNDMYKSLVLANAVFSTLYFIIMAAFGLTCMRLFKKLGATLHSPLVAKTLTQVTLTYSVVYSGILFYCVLNGLDSQFEFYPTHLREANTVILGYTSDLMTLSLPFILTVHDANVKKELFGKITSITMRTFTAV